jgi:subtilisin family serine protease
MMPAPSRRLHIEPLEGRLAPAAFPDHVLVTVAGPSLESQRQAVLQGVPGIGTVERLADGLYRADVVSGVAEVVAALAGRDGVSAAQPDYVLTPQAVPNDPGYAGMWQYPVTDAPAAWGVSTGTGSTVVAVIDTGVDGTHPDLAANVWRNPREVAGNGRDDDGNGFADDVTGWNFVANGPDVSDDAGHGTHAAGIVGAVGDNGLGVAGVNWRARIMPLKFMTASGGYTSDAIRAVDYAVANGAKVINASFGGGPYNPAFLAAIGRARDAGVVVVAAAGNYSTNTDATPFYPAGYAAASDNVVSVAATTSSDGLASFSNYGATTVTVAAPGWNVNSTLPGNRYGLKSGTSMAAPFVAGAISLLWDAKPWLTYRQVIDKLRASVDATPALAGRVASGGRLDLGKLLDAPAAAPPTVPPVAPPTTPLPVVADAVIGGPRAGVVDRAWVRFAAPADPAAVARTAVFTTPAGTVSPSGVLTVAGTNNTQFTLTLGRQHTAAGTYTLSIGGFGRSLVVGTPTVPPPASPPVPTAGRQSVSSTAARPIQDGRTTRVELFVPTTTPVRDVAVQLTLSHPRVSDLSVRLVAPDGRRFTLFNRRGGTGANLSATLFTDAATQGVAGAAAPFAGAVRPEQSLAPLNGTGGRGTWAVEVSDVVGGAVGTLTGVTLSFAPATQAPTAVTGWLVDRLTRLG